MSTDRESEPFRMGPMTIPEILDSAFRLYRRSFWRCYAVVLVPTAAAYLVTEGVQRAAGVTVEPMPSEQLKVMFFAVVAALIALVASVYATGAMTLTASELCHGRRPRVGWALGRALRALGRMLLARLVVFLVVAAIVSAVLLPLGGGVFVLLMKEIMPLWLGVTLLGFITLLAWLLGVVYTFRFLLTQPAILVEGRSAVGALQRSRELVIRLSERGVLNPRNHLVRASAIYLVYASLLMCVNVMVAIGTGLWLRAMHLRTGQSIGVLMERFRTGPMIVVDAISRLAYCIPTGYLAMCLVVFYYEIRSRREGYDLERALDAFAAEEPADG